VIWATLSRFDPEQPVFVESESKKIGSLRVPDPLIAAMRASPCIRIEVPLAARVKLLIEDYAHFLDDPEAINSRLAHLSELRGHETVAAWQELARQHAWPELVAALLAQHYDPAYHRSLSHNYAATPGDLTFHAQDLSADGVQRLAREILAAA
jgi:tRNA 2-selenouridine synthase